MPIHHFQCQTCFHEFDELIKNSDPNPQCELCDAETIRTISSGAFHLKGTGWYKTDFSGQPAPRTVYTEPPKK